MPGPVNTSWGNKVCESSGSKLIAKIWVNKNWGSGPVNTNWGPGPVNTNEALGLGTRVRASFQVEGRGPEIERPSKISCIIESCFESVENYFAQACFILN